MKLTTRDRRIRADARRRERAKILKILWRHIDCESCSEGEDLWGPDDDSTELWHWFPILGLRESSSARR